MRNFLRGGIALIIGTFVCIGFFGCSSTTTTTGDQWGSLNVAWTFDESLLLGNSEVAGGKDVHDWPVNITSVVISVNASDMGEYTHTVTNSNIDSYLFDYIPAGTNRTVTVEGYNTYDELIYSGERTGVSIPADDTGYVNITLDNQVPVWREVSSPTTNDLSAVDMTSTNNGWACGRNGTIIHYNGSSWGVYSSGVTTNLQDISFLDSDTGWVVGLSGVALRYASGNFIQETVPGDPNLYSVYTVSGNDAWAVGQGGVIVHWDGSSWTSMTSPTTHNLNNVTFHSANLGYACGDNGVIVRYTGNQWVVDTTVSGTDYLIAIDFPHNLNGWTVGHGGKIYHFDGTGWSNVYSPTNENFRGMDMFDVTYGMAAAMGGEIAEYDNGTWSKCQVPTEQILSDVDCVSISDSWAVGSAGTILHYSH